MITFTGTIPAESSSAAKSSECYGNNLAPVCSTGSKIAITSYHDGFKAASLQCPLDSNATGNCCLYNASGDCRQENPTESRYVDEFSGRDSGVISTSTVEPSSNGTCNNSNYSPVSVFSQLEYICIQDTRIVQLCSSSSSNHTLPLYLQNRNYPNGIPNTDTNCTCSVEALSGGSIDLYIVHMDLYETPENCQQTLTVRDVDGNILKTFNCDNEEFNIIKTETIAQNSIVIELINNFTTTNAGKFWLGFLASDPGSEIKITCQPDPKEHIDCKSPIPENGYSSSVNTNVSSLVTIICEPGYTRSGSQSLLCQANGSWNDTVSCTAVDCGNFSVTNGTVRTPQGTGYNALAVVACNRGYTINGDSLVTCQSNGNWSYIPSCDIIDCGAPSLMNGDANTTLGTTYGNAALLTCDTGYTLVGNNTAWCREDGVWNSTAYCEIKDCGAPSLMNGYANTTMDTTYGNAALLTCDTGYTLVGNNTAWCGEDGVWNSTAFCEIKDCSIFSVTNGTVSTPQGTEYNALAFVNCNRGYKINGESLVTCQSNGNWSYIPSCEIIGCGDPTPTNGSVDGTVFTYNSTVTITCNTGFTLTGSETITCLDGGQWSETVTCNIIDCGAPSLMNGYANATMGTTYGNTALLTCDTGYTLLGNDTAWCGEDGVWNSTAFCEIKDCRTFSVTNGTVSTPQGTEYNALASVNCDRGYKRNGESLVSCQSNGNWSYIPSCDIIECGTPTLQDGNISTASNTTYGERVDLSCNTGYTLDGVANAWCLETGLWNISAICTLQDCGDPTPSFGAAQTPVGTSYGAVALVTCNSGYILQGDALVTCDENGIWSSSTICVIGVCEDPTPVFGDVSTDNFTVNSTVMITCNSGYVLVGEANVTCMESGTWSNATTCVPVDCGEPATDNAIIDDISGTTLNHTAHFSCNIGYSLNGTSAVICLESGNWNSTISCIVQDCGDPSPAFGMASTPSGTTYGQIALVSCDTGYTLHGDALITCQEGENWSSNVTCIVVDCGDPTPVSGYTSTDNFTFNSTLSVTCNAGHVLGGPENIRCQADGFWSDAPTCTSVDCGNPLSSNADLQTMSGTAYNDTASFTCRNGYTSNSSTTITCMDTGVWTNTVNCTVIDCGSVATPTNGAINTTDTSFNTNVIFSCSPGYELQGVSQISCLETGTWNGSVPVCSKTDTLCTSCIVVTSAAGGALVAIASAVLIYIAYKKGKRHFRGRRAIEKVSSLYEDSSTNKRNYPTGVRINQVEPSKFNWK